MLLLKSLLSVWILDLIWLKSSFPSFLQASKGVLHLLKLTPFEVRLFAFNLLLCLLRVPIRLTSLGGTPPPSQPHQQCLDKDQGQGRLYKTNMVYLPSPCTGPSAGPRMLVLGVTDHSLPDEGPRISGGRPRYQVGDMVRVNCTSGRSKPAAQLVWFINGQQADSSFLRGPDILQNGREDLETSVLGLEFRVMPKHFKRGDMKLKCLATIATVYWRSNEESVEGDRPQRTPVLESRETVPPSQSRADRVQGQYSGGVMRRVGREKVQGQYSGGVMRRVGREKVQVLCKVLADSLGPVMWNQHGVSDAATELPSVGGVRYYRIPHDSAWVCRFYRCHSKGLISPECASLGPPGDLTSVPTPWYSTLIHLELLILFLCWNIVRSLSIQQSVLNNYAELKLL
uniref:CD80-like immunoglobulin C2-set domain-containing protein n=1 Tax=Timema shepardi TaxID=629360 RepID=A0A7R9G3Y7_TIMSH|nr:unnamed protein product [Timema shepardi]